MKIVLNAGTGHKAVWSLTPDDFIETVSDSIPAHTHEDTVHTNPDQTSQSITSEGDSAQNRMSQEVIAHVVAATLDQKLGPVMAKLAEMDQQRIKLSDILGGLGYIIGLVGLAAYMHYRRITKDNST